MGVAQAMEMLPAAPPLRAEEHEQLKAVVLDIADIQPYEHNPRRAAHAEYGRIKASIRADGLEQPLVVTRRPGEPDYRLHAGGNTRLKILKELFAETGERRFARLACWYRAWRDEAEVVLAHLKENDLRGDLIFRDKALAVANAERWLVAECGEKLTQARLAEMLAGRGYPLSQGLISQMKYAVERLLPVMPNALEAGLGRRQAMRIRGLDRVARALWLECTPDPEADYDEVFGALCRRYDAPEWELGQLRRGLEAEIAEQAEVSIHAVSLDLDEGLAGRPFGATAGDEEEEDEWGDWDVRGATAAQRVACGKPRAIEGAAATARPRVRAYPRRMAWGRIVKPWRFRSLGQSTGPSRVRDRRPARPMIRRSTGRGRARTRCPGAPPAGCPKRRPGPEVSKRFASGCGNTRPVLPSETDWADWCAGSPARGRDSWCATSRTPLSRSSWKKRNWRRSR